MKAFLAHRGVLNYHPLPLTASHGGWFFQKVSTIGSLKGEVGQASVFAIYIITFLHSLPWIDLFKFH